MCMYVCLCTLALCSRLYKAENLTDPLVEPRGTLVAIAVHKNPA
jgi:hypothetical protein